ncbi:hypothetical protein KBI23_19345 [bacterium]|nr:hypothetical protein [bacterium]
MKCRSCLKRLEPDGKFCTGCGVEAIIDEAQRLNSPGVSFLPEAFAESTYQFASALVEDPFFHNSFVNYILTMNVNATKQGHLRA